MGYLMKNKVVIIGCGNVGMSYAYALLNQKTKVNELVLIDLDYERTVGEAMDLNHGMAFSPSKINIKAGSYSDCFDASIVCIAAGANQAPGETRLDLLHKNSNIFESIVKNVVASGFGGIFLVATNPVDIMTYVTWKHSNFPQNRVIGSGTTLDTARLRYVIGDRLNINSKNIHAYVMGEHGDSEFVSWSNAYVGSNPISNYISIEELDKIGLQVKNAAYEIIKRKNATYYAIGMVLVRITNAILDDESTILTVSSYLPDHDVFIGSPSIVDRNGVKEVIKLNLNQKEEEAMINSINIIRKEIEKL
jgi:L-lactate dehydrogenase